MTIQLNPDKNLSVGAAFGIKLATLLSEELCRFSEHITGLEVLLSYENSSKNGINDKRCLFVAPLEGRQPIAVTEMANTYELAENSAIDKLKTSLDTILGRIRSDQRG